MSRIKARMSRIKDCKDARILRMSRMRRD